MRIEWVSTALVAACIFCAPLAAQTRTRRKRKALDVFLDCETAGCTDFDFFRRQIPYVNWVRNREVADLQILITSRTTGGGGQSFQISFLGRRTFAGHDENLGATTPGDATEDEVRKAVARKLELGLVAYLVNTPVADRLRVSLAGKSTTAGQAHPSGATTCRSDPWHCWVFSIGGSGFLDGESSETFTEYSGSVGANRTTRAWRMGVGASYYWYEERFDLSNGWTRSLTKDWELSSYLVRTMGAQWALGIQATAGSSTFFNQSFDWTLEPGVEYDFFPYKESSRRSLTLEYLIGPTHFDYQQRTIYGYLHETRAQQSVSANLALVQPWGSWSTQLTGADYADDASKYHVTLQGGLDIRLFKGFFVKMTADYTWLHDQIYIPALGVTDQQVLLRDRQLATSFTYFTSFAITYKFGSIFNNVVNPRFGSVRSSGEVLSP